MLTEHFAPTGLGPCGLAMAINISLLTEFSCVCSNRKFPNSMAVGPGRGEFTNWFAHGPPHPAPLLPPREEREFVCLARGGTGKMRP